MTTVDVYAAWLTAGENLRPYGDWIAANWVNLVAAASLAVIAWRILRWAIRPRVHVPAAFDNQPPVDDDALIECRRIARLHTANPDMWRRADNYLRQKGDETP